ETVRAGVEIYERLRKLGQLERPTERYLGRAYNSLGLIVAGRGRLQEAEKLCDQAADLLGGLLKDYPDQFYYREELVRTRTLRGTLQGNCGDYPKARDHFRQAVQVDLNSAQANNELAWFLVTCPDLSLRDVREAVQLAKKAVAAKPQEGAYWNTLGVAH